MNVILLASGVMGVILSLSYECGAVQDPKRSYISSLFWR